MARRRFPIALALGGGLVLAALLIAALLSLVVGLVVYLRRWPERDRVAEIDLRTRPAPTARRPAGVMVGGDTGRDGDRSERGGSSDA